MSTAGVESHYAIKYGPLHQVSEQQLVSCDTGNSGCGGGWPTTAYYFWSSNGCIDLELYPYSNDEAACYQDEIEERRFYTGSPSYVDSTQGDLDQFKADIRSGPVTVAFGVGDDFMYYSSGVFTGGCSESINHGMVAIGYGVNDEGMEYAIVRNSWGTFWGESGYVKVKIGTDDPEGGLCDLYMYPNYPVMA